MTVWQPSRQEAGSNLLIGGAMKTFKQGKNQQERDETRLMDHMAAQHEPVSFDQPT